VAAGFVDGVFIAEAADAALPTGRVGIGSNGARATFSSFNAYQP
jgi:hypothetical protein